MRSRLGSRSSGRVYGSGDILERANKKCHQSSIDIASRHTSSFADTAWRGKQKRWREMEIEEAKEAKEAKEIKQEDVEKIKQEEAQNIK